MEKEEINKEFAKTSAYAIMKKKRRIFLWNIILTTIALVMTIIIFYSPIIKVSGEKFFTYQIRAVKNMQGNSNDNSNNDDAKASQEVYSLIAYLLVGCPVDTYLEIKDIQIKAAMQQKESPDGIASFSYSDESNEYELKMQEYGVKAVRLLLNIAKQATELYMMTPDEEFEESLKIASKNFGEEYSAELNLIDYCKLVAGESFWGVASKGLKVGDVPFMFMSDPFSAGYGAGMPIFIGVSVLFNVIFLCVSVIKFCFIKRITFNRFIKNNQSDKVSNKKAKREQGDRILFTGNLLVYLAYFAFIGLAHIPVKLGGYWDVFLTSLSCTAIFIVCVIIEVIAGIVSLFAWHSEKVGLS